LVPTTTIAPTTNSYNRTNQATKTSKNQTSSEIDTSNNDNSKIEEQCKDQGAAKMEIDKMTGSSLEERSLLYSSSTSLHSHQDIVNSNQPIKDVDTQKIKMMTQRWADIFKKESLRGRETKDTQKFHQIKSKPMETSNLPVGDKIHEETDLETILFHNINWIRDETNWYQILMTMKELRADIFGFTEINRTMERGIKQKWEQTSRKLFQHSRTINSESKIPAEHYKPGGTLMMITGKWQARISEKGSDDSGLGRWSYFKISSNKQSLVIITVYRHCVSSGPSTTSMQQWTLLHKAGNQNPDPIKTFYADVDDLLTKWKKLQYEIIVLIDANETIGNKPGGLAPILNRIGLTDLIHSQHHLNDTVNTHARGSKRIDYVLGTRKVQENCARSGMLPYGVGYQSDHRALFIKVNLQEILQTTVSQMDTIMARKLMQATPALSLRRLGVLMLLKSRLSLCLIVEEARWELCFFFIA
jgi:hypothetical protein